MVPSPSLGSNSPLGSPPALQGNPPSTAPVDSDFRWTSVLLESGIRFRHESGDSPMKAFPAANGSGIGVFDLDRDGLTDVLFLTNNMFEPGSAPQSNMCYRNIGSLRFTDVTLRAGLGFAGYSAGVAAADINSDGFPEVYLNCYGKNQLYENCGDGTFENISDDTGTSDPRWGTSAAFLDLDGDELLDLYVGNYAKWSPEENIFCGDEQRKIRMYCSPKSVSPEEDVLYKNTGEWRFQDISISSGIRATTGRTQGVLATDINQDGMTDLYVSHDLNPNALWINQGAGTFQDQANLLGVAYDFKGSAQAGMGIAMGDGNRDGLFDLFVTNFEGEHNAYYEHDSAGFFNEISHQRGLASASLPWIGWGTAMSDFNLDGWADIVVVNGHTDNNMHDIGREGEYLQPALLWRNDGAKFTHVRPVNSPYFETGHAARGLAMADLDNDLDMDLLCSHLDQAPDVLRNDCPRTAGLAVLQLQLVGEQINRDAIGAIVRCQMDDRQISEQVTNGGSYLCAPDSRLTLAVPSQPEDGRLKLTISWGLGKISEVDIPAQSGRGIILGSTYYPLP